MEEKRITSHQLFTLTALSTLGGSILVVSSTVATVAKNDLWISALFTMVLGLVVVSVFVFLAGRHEGQTLIGINKTLFGKWLGLLISAGYVFYFFTTTYGIVWYIGSFGSHVMHETPPIVISGLYVIGLIIAVCYGIETIGRASELLYSFCLVLFLLFIGLVLPKGRIDYIMPVLENGFVPVMKGGILLSCFIVFNVITTLMVFPSVNDYLKGKKSIYKGFLWSNSVVFIAFLVSVLVLGSVVIARSSFPTILLAREISIGTVLTRLEYAISVIWTVSEFVIGVLYFYACIHGLSELLGLREPVRIAIPMGLIVLILSTYKGSVEQLDFILTAFVPQQITFGFILPVIMLFVYLFKKYSEFHKL
jgi:spore germination protein KB